MEELNNIVLTEKRFSQMVETLVKENNIPYMDAVLEICSYKGIDPSDINPILSNHIKDMIYTEAVNGNLIKHNTNRLVFQ